MAGGSGAKPGYPAPQRHYTLADSVYEQILSDIVDGVLPENARLPAEGALAERFGVSRPVVREALARLRDDGIVVSRRGSGSYVTARPSRVVRAFAPLSSIADMQRCFEFRVGLEGEAARQAALRRNDEDIARIKAALATLDEILVTTSLGVEEDYQFHLAVAAATHNRFYVGTLEFLHESITTGMNLTRNLSLRRSSERLRVVQNEHYEVMTAIVAGEGEGAARAMRAHLENARRRVFEGVDNDDATGGALR